LKPHFVVAKLVTGKPRPGQHDLSFFDPLFRRPSLVVELDDALGAPGQVRHDESDARKQLPSRPLDLRHHPPWLLPALRLIPETVMKHLWLVGRSADRTRH